MERGGWSFKIEPWYLNYQFIKMKGKMENNSTVMPSWKNGSISIIVKLQEKAAKRFGPNFERIPYDL